MLRRVGVAAALLAAVVGCADRERPSSADARLMFRGEHDFRRVAVNATRELKVSLMNVGRSRLNVLEIWVEDRHGAYRAWFDHPGPHDLMPGSTCDAVIRFSPKSPGSFPGTLVVRSDSIEEPLFRVDLSGLGLDAKARIAESHLDFGRIELGSTKTKRISLENPSELPVTVTPHLVGADKDEFAIDPLVLRPFEKRTVEVAFAPTRIGVKQAALAITPCEGCVDEVVTLAAEGLDRAVVAIPDMLDFGQVPIDRDAKLAVKLRNISTEPQDVTGFSLAPDTDPSFVHLEGTTPFTLDGGEERSFVFRFSPGHMGQALGSAVWTIGSKRNPTLTVPMAGYGGAPELCISPDDWTFPEVPVGAKVQVTVTVRNCGTSNAAPLTITDLVKGPNAKGIEGDDQFSLSGVQLPVTLAAGEELTFRIFYEPTRAGEHGASVGVRTNGFQASVARVDVQGSAREHLPCRLAITPEAVDFGTVVPGGEAVLGVKVNNVGTDVCPVKNIRLADDAGEVFDMPGGEIDGVIVEPGYWFSFMVRFMPPESGGTFAGALQIEQSDPGNPVILVPLSGNAQPSCITAKPRWLDFGITRPGCGADTLTTVIENVCSTPVELSGVTIGPGTTDGEFVLAAFAPMPLVLQPKETTPISVSYLGSVAGMNLSPLFVDASGLDRPYLVPLIGESSQNGEVTDTFVQQDGSKVDVLFVVDNTASMVEEHPKLVQAIPAFINAARARNVDLHVAVTTTGIEPASNACPGGAMGGEAGRFFPVDHSNPRVLTLDTPDVTRVLQRNVAVGQCAFVEQGFEALQRALSPPLVDHPDDARTAAPDDGNAGFLRASAGLAVIFVGDEDDHSPGEVSDYVSWLRGLKGRSQPSRSVIYAIAPDGQSCGTAGGDGTRYAEAAAKTGGEVLSICAGDYGPMLASLAGKAFSPQRTFALSSVPQPGTLQVFVDGVEQGGGWGYDGAHNQIVFDADPPAGAQIEARYQKTCD
ncbi:MAG: choice-of-anchor D domain-containing protein [Myxococcaceae bacterium]|nr:choice-of-anchor D domain-containing protein [Myxococcaceae bacterium]